MPIDQNFLAHQTRLLCASYQHWTGLHLIEATGASVDTVQQLFDAPYAVASHDVEADPLFNYANRQAQQLFGMCWEEIIGLPSRYSAEPMAREERAGLLERVSSHGYVDDYSGIRIAKDGTRFMINNATVWNVLDATGIYCGQGVFIKQWIALYSE